MWMSEGIERRGCEAAGRAGCRLALKEEVSNLISFECYPAFRDWPVLRSRDQKRSKKEIICHFLLSLFYFALMYIYCILTHALVASGRPLAVVTGVSVAADDQDVARVAASDASRAVLAEDAAHTLASAQGTRPEVDPVLWRIYPHAGARRVVLLRSQQWKRVVKSGYRKRHLNRSKFIGLSVKTSNGDTTAESYKRTRKWYP